VPQDDRANIAACRHPLAVIPTHRAPPRRLGVADPLRDRANERLDCLLSDWDRLLSIDLFEVLYAGFGKFDQLGRVSGKIASQLFEKPICGRTGCVTPSDERQLIVGEPVEEICFAEFAPFTGGTVLHLPAFIGQALQ
jgi:hypothetical protein